MQNFPYSPLLKAMPSIVAPHRLPTKPPPMGMSVLGVGALGDAVAMLPVFLGIKYQFRSFSHLTFKWPGRALLNECCPVQVFER